MESQKTKRCFTVMIVPHNTEESTFSLRIPLFVVQIAVATLVLGLVGVTALGYAYLKASSEARDADSLRQINRAQQEEINALAIETERMMEQIELIDELVEQVTDKLDLEPEDLTNGVENQVFSGLSLNAPDKGHEVYELDRLYGSRSSSEGVLGRASDNINLLQSIVPERSETLDTVGEFALEADAKPSIWPCRGRMISGFGMRAIPYGSGYQFHNGVDIIGSHSSAIWATAPGKVVFTGYRGSYGNMVIVDHGHGYETYYAHLTGFAVNSGQLVERDQVVGYMGASGRTTGTHLHYEVRFNGSPVNPINYMKKQ